MHSNRMRTGRALTVSGVGGGGGGVGGCAYQKNFYLGENKLKKKFKKISDPPQKFGADPPKIWVRHPPENLGQTVPPRKFGSDPPENLGQTPPRKFGPDPTPRVDRQTPVNLLPWPNFVAAGNCWKANSPTANSYTLFTVNVHFSRSVHIIWQSNTRWRLL